MPTIRQFAFTIACCAALLCLSSGITRAGDGQTPKEKELLALLRSDAAPADKAVTCKHLAVYGSVDAVPDLAKLLPNEQLSSWARIALEAIPGPEADEALRKGSETLEGRLLVGTLNSIGFRRDALAVDLLTGRLADKDAEVASAAAVALGRVGNDGASKALRAALATTEGKTRSAVAEGLVLVAERRHSEGKGAEAAEIYDEVRKADVPKQRKIEATRGAILSRNDEGIPLLLELLASEDKAMFQLALGTIREFPGNAVDKSLAAEIAKATPERGALLIGAMADRRATVDLAAIQSAAGTGPKAVRLAALAALRRVGNDGSLASLLEIALDADAELAQTAKEALSELQGDKINSAIVTLLANAQGKTHPLLLDLVAQRRIAAIDEVLKAVDNSDKTIRTAALTALGAIVDLEKLPVLIGQVVKPKFEEDSAAAQLALKTACVRMPDREACATQLATALESVPSATKTMLLETLAAVGGTKALETVGTAARSKDATMQDVASRLLGKWMTDDAAPVLLDLTKTAPSEKYQLRALRGYIRIANQFVLPIDQRMELCRTAYAASKQPAEKKLVLEIVKRYPTVDGMKLAISASESADVKDEAKGAALVIAQKIGGKVPEVRDLLAKIDIPKVNLEIVKATYGGGATQKDVTEIVQKAATDLPMVTLANTSFNAAFGGDPIPGTAKQLKIQYKINGKPGEASFAEDALIILPMPK